MDNSPKWIEYHWYFFSWRNLRFHWWIISVLNPTSVSILFQQTPYIYIYIYIYVCVCVCVYVCVCADACVCVCVCVLIKVSYNKALWNGKHSIKYLLTLSPVLLLLTPGEAITYPRCESWQARTRENASRLRRKKDGRKQTTYFFPQLSPKKPTGLLITNKSNILFISAVIYHCFSTGLILNSISVRQYGDVFCHVYW